MDDNKKNKILITVAIGIILIVVVVLLARIFSDDTNKLLADTLSAQATVIELGKAAATNAANLETRNLAADISATTSSDRERLAAFPAEGATGANPAVIEELETARENFDRTYLELTERYLIFSQDLMESIMASSTNEELQNSLEAALINHEMHLERIERLTQ